MSSNKNVFISPIDESIVENVDGLLEKNKSGTHLIFGLKGIEIETVFDNNPNFLKTMFPKYSNDNYSSIEALTSQEITGEMDYYTILYSGFPNPPVNTFASWVNNPAFCNLEAKGNFVLVHKKWINEEETNVPLTGTFKEILDKFGMTIQTNVNVDDELNRRNAFLETYAIPLFMPERDIHIHKPFLDEKNNELWEEEKKNVIKNNKLLFPLNFRKLTHYKKEHINDEYIAIPEDDLTKIQINILTKIIIGLLKKDL